MFGLWNGVEWMVSWSFFLFLTPVAKLVGVVCTEVSVAPNVELSGTQKHMLLNVVKEKRSYIPKAGVQLSKERLERDRM